MAKTYGHMGTLPHPTRPKNVKYEGQNGHLPISYKLSSILPFFSN